MFESVALGRSYSKKEFEDMEPDLRLKLFNAQREIIKRKIPVVIIIAGVDGAGRGALVNALSDWMDAKGLRNHTFWMETDEERMRPYPWRFWRKLPAGGEIGVFFGGWYSSAIRTFCCGDIPEETFNKTMHRWARLEHTLAASGTVMVKLWLHIDKKTHKERMKERLKHDDVHHFAPYDKKSSENYDELVSAAAKAIRITDRIEAPWTLVDAKDPNFRNASAARAITAAIEKALIPDKNKETKREPEETADSAGNKISILDKIDLTKSIDHGEYKKEFAKLKGELFDLTYKTYKKGISSTLVFEGWDAAGKGGAIRRIAGSIDARITQVIPISAPTDEELAHNYLWRFWRNIPMAGFVTIYDRSWYGRVLVERVENLASPEEWGRAYAEINDFEEQLTEGNNILLKFWMHISPEEQLKRFKEREETPWKNYKITPEDWRNREKRPAYMEATEEMFSRTGTDIAPWHIIAAEDKKFSRLEVMRIYKEALEAALDKEKKHKKH